MKKRLAVVISIFLLIVSMTAVAFADNPVKLIINGRLIKKTLRHSL